MKTWIEIVKAIYEASGDEVQVARVPRGARTVDGLVIDMGFGRMTPADAGAEIDLRKWINSLPLDHVAGLNQEFVDAALAAMEKNRALADRFAPLRSSGEMITGAQIVEVFVSFINDLASKVRSEGRGCPK